MNETEKFEYADLEKNAYYAAKHVAEAQAAETEAYAAYIQAVENTKQAEQSAQEAFAALRKGKK